MNIPKVLDSEEGQDHNSQKRYADPRRRENFCKGDGSICRCRRGRSAR